MHKHTHTKKHHLLDPLRQAPQLSYPSTMAPRVWNQPGRNLTRADHFSRKTLDMLDMIEHPYRVPAGIFALVVVVACPERVVAKPLDKCHWRYPRQARIASLASPCRSAT